MSNKRQRDVQISFFAQVEKLCVEVGLGEHANPLEELLLSFDIVHHDLQHPYESEPLS